MTDPAKQILLDRYVQAVASTGLYANQKNLRFMLGRRFQGVPLAGRKVLDIGAGSGVIGMYAACAGAARVVCLEPEAAGSTGGVTGKFAELKQQIGIDAVTMLPQTLQEFQAGAERFDVLVMEASINHLDERACIDLHRDERARESYRGLFKKLHELASPGAHLIIADAARRNLFGDLGMTNPFFRDIQWHKHQQPSLWARLLGEAGFREPWVRWETFNSLGEFGRIFLCNRVAAYLLLSRFLLVMRK